MTLSLTQKMDEVATFPLEEAKCAATDYTEATGHVCVLAPAGADDSGDKFGIKVYGKNCETFIGYLSDQ